MKYQELRLNRANRVQQQSRAAEHMFHMHDPEEIAQRNARFARHQPVRVVVELVRSRVRRPRHVRHRDAGVPF